jgi:hypothetical protein
VRCFIPPPATRRLAPIAAVILLLASAACGPRPYQSLNDTAEPLRSIFNRYAGHVRVVMLVAPT